MSERNLRAAALQDTLPELEVRHLDREEIVRARLDVAILARTAFETTSALVQFRRKIACNVLVVVDQQEEDDVLDALLPGDDVARPDSSMKVLLSRAERVALGAVTQLDGLTRVLAKGAWLERLERALDTATAERPVSVMVCDLDFFKRINDALGHLAGDDMLRAVAMRLRDHARSDSCIGRLGGEEFAIFLTADAAASMIHADEIRTAVKAAPLVEGEYVTVSIGLATVTGPTEIATVLRRADEALYSAKANGRDRCVHYLDFAREAIEHGAGAEVQTFENLTRVIAERVAEAITHRGRKVFDALRAEADHDGLTGLYSRRYLDRRLPFEVEHAQGTKIPMTVALFDLDNFGAVNKEHGWPTGDRVLRSVADTVAGGVREEDWVARYGGEEILVVLARTGLDDAAPVLERVRAQVEALAHDLRGGSSLKVTVSIGAAGLKDDESLPELMERVSAKLLEAKKSGKNRTAV